MARLHFKLHDFVKGAITRMVPTTIGTGKYTYKRLTFLPDQPYFTDDEAFARFIKGEIGDVKQKTVRSEELVNLLNSLNIPFDPIKKCGSCPSAVAKIAYNPFKFTENEDEL